MHVFSMDVFRIHTQSKMGPFKFSDSKDWDEFGARRRTHDALGWQLENRTQGPLSPGRKRKLQADQRRVVQERKKRAKWVLAAAAAAGGLSHGEGE